MKFLLSIVFSYLFSLPHPLLGGQEPKQEKTIIQEQKKNNIQLKKELTPEEIKKNEENAERYRQMIAALGGKMIEAKL